MANQTVLIISQTASVVGGVETWLDKVCAALPAHGWRPIAGLVRGIELHRPERFLAMRPGLDSVEIDGRGLPAEGRVRAVIRCIRRVRPQVVVPLVVADAHEGACRAKAAGQQVKYVAPLHGNVPAQIADLRRYAAFVDLAACPGRLTCRMAEWAGVPADRVRHIPNGAEPPRWPHVPRQPGQPLRLGYVGRMTQADKRVLDLVPFCRTLDEMGVPFSLDVVGDGNEREALHRQLAAANLPFVVGDDVIDACATRTPGQELQRSLARRAGVTANRESGNSVRIRFRGSRSPDFLYEQVYPELDCLLLFSESEAFGIVVYEAMLHGVVPVTSRFLGHAAEGLLRDGETGLLFDVGDARGGAACVRRLAGDPGLWERLSLQAERCVTNHFGWNACILQWSTALDTVLELPFREGRSLPSRASRGHGKLEALPLSEGCKDAVRRARRKLFGPSAAMSGGEEWPWVNQDHDPELLRQIDMVRRELDTATSERPSPELTQTAACPTFSW
jgi:glycosyltransferase involved in cell wall biosynthesis